MTEVYTLGVFMSGQALPNSDSATRAGARLGFFGGSFDPPHRGHVALAQAVVSGAQLDRLFFVPAARNPLKGKGPHAPGSIRLEMLRAATQGDPNLGVIDWELERPPPSFTLDTVAYLEGRFPQAERFWVIGADQLPGLPVWREIEQLARRVRFLIVARPGAPRSVPAIPGLELSWVEAPLFPHSSTEVRERIRKGLSVDNLVPLPVLERMRRHPQLYR